MRDRVAGRSSKPRPGRSTPSRPIRARTVGVTLGCLAPRPVGARLQVGLRPSVWHARVPCDTYVACAGWSQEFRLRNQKIRIRFPSGVGGGPQEAGARGSPGVVREVGRVLALADGWGEEAAIFSGEVVQQGAALLEGQVAGIMEVFWQPVEDMMEEVEEVAEEQQQQEEQEEQKQEEPGRGPTIPGSPLEALEALEAAQLQLEPVNRQCFRSYFRLRLTALRRRKHYLEHRSTIIQSIPGFWFKVFVNDRRMSAMMSAQDKDILSYMTNLKVEELRYPSDCRKITLFFRNNPYFQNEVVVKEYLVHVTGYRASHSTPIQWHHRFEREAYSRRHHNSGLNFFSWFSDHSCAGSSRIAEIIGEDLWPNPLRYYPREEGPTGTGTPDFEMRVMEHHPRPKKLLRMKANGQHGCHAHEEMKRGLVVKCTGRETPVNLE
ncbi:testis-specific Y-encoded protein 3-like [Mesoplodon densirostris]|uniref:testis-specific Y-encoded protein 3-like n=1 Tax=Mesoplodon densirostris TaxID=48708 RepID=UPI0028DC7DCF|nr:testis-specific Y-encoded protein 3-like [Mesoplodon densirostris]